MSISVQRSVGGSNGAFRVFADGVIDIELNLVIGFNSNGTLYTHAWELYRERGSSQDKTKLRDHPQISMQSGETRPVDIHWDGPCESGDDFFHSLEYASASSITFGSVEVISVDRHAKFTYPDGIAWRST